MTTVETVDPFPDVAEFNDTMRTMVTDCNGFVYAGGDLEAQIRCVKWLRAHPIEAAVLLDPALGGDDTVSESGAEASEGTD